MVPSMTADPALAQAQVPDTRQWDVGRILVGRPELEELTGQLQQIATSAAYSSALRERAREEARLIQHRLEEGDFQVGDQILVSVEGEQDLSATFLVMGGLVVSMPVIGDVPLRGVLRSELEAHLADHLARFIRDPRVQARSLVRIAILGEVGRPGFYLVPSELPLSDALMLAGGPSASAELQKTRVVRGTDQIWTGSALQRALAEGQTLDRMSLRAGDQIVIPPQQDGRVRPALQTMTMVVPVLISLLTLFAVR
jgi:protein involved in polysaccharide export with SLBB domain